MLEARPLEVIFLTNFNDYCYRSIPAIAQMSDDFAIRLTIAYASGSNVRSLEDKAKLDAFFLEADAYPRCRRLLMPGDPVNAVLRLSNLQPVDLLIAPAADPLGLPRIGHRSLRTRLLRETRIPLWTIGRKTHQARLRGAPKHVGCWIDFHRGWTNHIAFASEYARAAGAELHILHALPEIHDGMWLRPGQPLFKGGVVEEVTKALGYCSVPTHFHIADDDSRRARTQLIQSSHADVVFVADIKPDLPSWLAPKPRLMDECTCPVVHVPVDTNIPLWRLVKEVHTTVQSVRSVPALVQPVRH